MMETRSRSPGFYETEVLDWGVVYRWCPACIEVSCECGYASNLTSSSSECPICGDEQRVVVRGDLAANSDVVRHPWRYAPWKNHRSREHLDF